MDNAFRSYFAELIGTMVLVLFGCGAAVFVGGVVGGGALAIAFAFGLTVVVMSATVGNISGAHLNPAVSLGMFLDKRIDLKTFVMYFIFQLVGAIIGAALLAVFAMGAFDCGFGDLGNLAMATNDAEGVGVAYAMIIEIVLTMIFVLIALAATAKNGMDKFAGLYIGLGLTMVHLVGIPLTGCSVNPARSLGASILHVAEGADFVASEFYVFLIAPLIGAAIAWAIWKFVLDDDAE